MSCFVHKPKRYSVYFCKETNKPEIFTFKKLKSENFDFFPLENYSNWLLEYQNSLDD